MNNAIKHFRCLLNLSSKSTAIVIFIFALQAQATFASPLHIMTQDAALEISSIIYREQPTVITEKGIMYGISYSLSILNDAQWKLEGKLSTGTVEYNGQYMDGTPVSVSGIRDTMFEVRALRGFTSPSAPFFSGPYWGLGYRYLDDRADKIDGGYRRESNYIYLPLGFETWRDFSSGSSWAIGLLMEFDYLLMGRQVSYLGNVNASIGNITNDQHDGYGLRTAVKFRKNYMDHNLNIEPYIRYWNIGKSDVVSKIVEYQGSLYEVQFWEPANTSTEIGVKLAIGF
jgi:hypothetical protein